MDEYFILYPIYFCNMLSLSSGRKFNKELCIDISYKELIDGIKRLDLKFIEERDKMHPNGISYGRVKVEKKYEKMFIVKGIVEMVKNMREEEKAKAKAVVHEEKEVKSTVVDNKEKKVKYISRKRANKNKKL